MKKLDPTKLIIIVGILFAMSILPGVGTKAMDQEAIVATKYTCESSTDCPICVLAGMNVSKELDTRECKAGYCQLSDSCLIWDCSNAGNCSSIKKTILDNTVEKFNANPAMLIAAVALLIAYLML